MPPRPSPPSAETAPIRDALRQFARMGRLVRRYWGALLKGMLLGMVLGLMGIGVPYLSKLLIDEVYPTGNVSLMHLLVLGLLILTLVNGTLEALRLYFSMYTTSHLANSTSLLFFTHVMHMRVRFFDQHRVGEVVSRFGEVRGALNILARLAEIMFTNTAYLILVPPFMFMLQPRLAMVALATVPLTVAITAGSSRVLRRSWKKTAEAYAELGALQVEVLSHIRTLKAMGTEHHVYKTAERAVNGALQVQLKAAGWEQVFGALNASAQALGTAVFTWYAWTLIVRGEMTLGTYVAFSAYVGLLLTPITQITARAADFQQAAVSLSRMFEYLDQPTEQDPTLAYLPPPPIQTVVRGEVEMRGVSFGYAAGKEVLHDVTVRFPRGGITSIVGPSGAGKSSLLRLIVRLEEPDGGELSVDGVPISSITIPDLRRQVTVVWQEFSMMQGTVWDNLTLGAVDPSLERVDDAVRLCRLRSLIDELPNGYDTPVAEFGASLSGGQRQRMSLARALIRDTPVLLLDEATSNIDMQTESVILRDLFARLQGKTVIYVTHRVQTAALADQIVVVEAGRVAAVGTHAELMRDSEAYRLLHGGGGEEIRRHAVPHAT
jgi:ABC-type bacteriocin/lantibiotic exporter with double-glycine peptidase domain